MSRRSSRSTYRGGAESRQRTVDLVSGMLHTTNLNPMAHIICVAHTRLELADILVSLRKAGVENLMALGGDPPEDPDAGPGELAYAAELVELARAIGGFSVGVAAHPAGHPRSPDLQSDRDFLAAKLGLADFGVTQFFFEAAEYESLVGDLRQRGVDTPVLPGILPVTSLSTMGRLGAMGAAAPTGCRTGSVRPTSAVAPTRSARKGWNWPPSSVPTSSMPACRDCTSTRSTPRARRVRSTPRSAWDPPPPVPRRACPQKTHTSADGTSRPGP